MDRVSNSNETEILDGTIFCYFFTGTQALVRPGSPNSSLSADDRATVVPICRAKAITDSTSNPYDKDALRFKVSDL